MQAKPFKPNAMIRETLQVITRNLNAHLRQQFDLSHDGAILSNVLGMDIPTFRLYNKVNLSVLHFQPQFSVASRLQEGGTNAVAGSEISFWIVNVLISVPFEGSKYDESLDHLEETISHFIKNPVLSKTSTPSLPESVQKVTISFVEQELMEWSKIWGDSGTTFYPSTIMHLHIIGSPAN